MGNLKCSRGVATEGWWHCKLVPRYSQGVIPVFYIPVATVASVLFSFSWNRMIFSHFAMYITVI